MNGLNELSATLKVTLTAAVGAAFLLTAATAHAGSVEPAMCQAGVCSPSFVPASTTSAVTAIPDNAPEGVVLGPVTADAGMSAGQMMLALTVSHPYSPDLSFTLHYDADGDGDPEATSAVEMHLARGFPFSVESWACTQALEGTYYFRDEGWREMGAEADFSVFGGLAPGGDWYLHVVDSAAGHTGTVGEWAVRTWQGDLPNRAALDTDGF